MPRFTFLAVCAIVLGCANTEKRRAAGVRLLLRLARVMVIAALAGCARKVSTKPDAKESPVPNAMYMVWCDSTPMKPLGRRTQIPEVKLRLNAAVLTGLVVQKETGDAIEGATIELRDLNPTPNPSRPFRYSDSKGGFAFDSVAPGSYRVLVRRIGEYTEADTVHPAASRVDTLRFRLRAYRCHGY